MESLFDVVRQHIQRLLSLNSLDAIRSESLDVLALPVAVLVGLATVWSYARREKIPVVAYDVPVPVELRENWKGEFVEETKLRVCNDARRS